MSFTNRIEIGEGAPMGPVRLGDLRMWANLSEYKLTREVPHPFRSGKFARKVKRSIFTDAAMKAVDAFTKAGALAPIQFDEGDVKVQEYPDDGVVAFVFRRFIAGEEKFFIESYNIRSIIGFLRVTGRWNDATKH